MTPSRQLAAIMFTDIVGYTALMGKDEQAAFKLLEQNRLLHKSIIQEFNGKWLKEMGDGVLLSFNAASDAVLCAKKIQEISQKKFDVSLRIGIHLGEVVFKEEDVFGDGVNIASRIESLAPAGCIYISESVLRNVENKKDIDTEFVGEKILKNVKHPISVYQVLINNKSTPQSIANPLSIQKRDASHRISAVGQTDNAPVTASQPKTRITRITKPLIFSIAVLVLITGYFLYPKLFSSSEDHQPIDTSIAVLPFTDISEMKDQAYFTDGMMIEILDHLFKMKNLRITPLNSTLKYKDSPEPLKEIANELGVAHLIQGSVRRAGNKVKISVGLFEGSTENYLWQHTYEDDIAEVSRIFVVQSDVASQIARALSIQITPLVNSRINTFPTESREAYDLYLKGSETIGEKSIVILNKALAIDSSFADVYVELGKQYWALAHVDDQSDLFRKSKVYLNKAIELDPNNSRAYSQLAVVNGHWDWDNEAGLRNLQKALSLNPADVRNHNDLFFYYMRTFNCDSMMTTLQTMKQLQSGDYYYHELMIKLCKGDEEGMREMNPTIAFMKSGKYRIANEWSRMVILKKYQQALKLLESTNRLSQDFILAFKATTFAHMGKRTEAKAEIARLEELDSSQDVSSALLATAHMAIGNDSIGFVHLEKGIQKHDPMIHGIQYYPPFYKNMDPKYQRLMKERWVN